MESSCLSNTNILVATWFDLILFNESPTVLYSIIEELIVSDGGERGIKKV